MGLGRLEPSEVVVEAVQGLGLDPNALDLTSAEVWAASLRRAAAFMCPTTPGALVRAVDDAIRRLPGVTDDTRSQVELTLNALVAYGDLLELPVSEDGVARRQLFLGAPAFVRRATGVCLLVGIRPDGAALVGDEMLDAIECDGHVRVVRLEPSRVDELMMVNGLMELRPEQWLRAPRQSSADDLVGRYLSRLDAAGPSGHIEGVRIIDLASSVTFYRGRWRTLKQTDVGRCVARRPQAFGADIWCFAEVQNGEIARLIDLPVESHLVPGADEAWRLQAALDVQLGRPQRIKITVGVRPELSILSLYSPVPSWAQRRLDIVGTPVVRVSGALFSYAVPTSEVDEEVRFLEEMMWAAVSPAREM